MRIAGEFSILTGFRDARVFEIELEIGKCQMAGIDRGVVFPLSSGDRKRELVEALEVPWNRRVEYTWHDEHTDDTHSPKRRKRSVEVRLSRALCSPGRRTAVRLDRMQIGSRRQSNERDPACAFVLKKVPVLAGVISAADYNKRSMSFPLQPRFDQLAVELYARPQNQRIVLGRRVEKFGGWRPPQISFL